MGGRDRTDSADPTDGGAVPICAYPFRGKQQAVRFRQNYSGIRSAHAREGFGFENRCGENRAR